MADHQQARIHVVQGDITKIEADAIVNAANESLLRGGGVDGAIHRAAGPELLALTRTLGGCPTGDAKLTPAFGLPARWIIHAVGPQWRGGGHQEDALLASAYRRSLEISSAAGARSVSFPAISTGIYHFPPERAAAIAVREIRAYLETHPLPERVLLVAFDAQTYEVLQAALTGA